MGSAGDDDNTGDDEEDFDAYPADAKTREFGKLEARRH
jgi:hypothetical protein